LHDAALQEIAEVVRVEIVASNPKKESVEIALRVSSPGTRSMPRKR